MGRQKLGNTPLSFSALKYEIEITVKDAAGNEAKFTFTLRVKLIVDNVAPE